ncbi:hypothetical protein AB0D38_03640 [Streptomyces sp. NPDC048279]|uniref:hypothetical protein n=1 Tax=Streptomyces sp. NPDC048279 TaxID=3154714 RepID=UPI003448B522
MAGPGVSLLGGTLFHEPGLSWTKILAVPSGLNEAPSSSSLPDSWWRTVVIPWADQGPSRTV